MTPRGSPAAFEYFRYNNVMIPNSFGGVYVQFVLAITFAIIGCVVYTMARKKRSSLFFLLIALSTATWTISNYFANNDSLYVYYINALVFLAGWLSIQFIVLFTNNFPEDNTKKLFDLLLFTPTIIFIFLLFFTRSIIAGTEKIPIGIDIVPGPFFHVYTFCIIVYFLLFIGLAIYKYHHAVGETRKQTLYLTLSFAVTILIAFFTNLIAPSILGIKDLSDYGPYVIIVVLGASSLVILRYRFLSTRLIFTEGAVYVLWFILAVDIGSSQTWGRLFLRILVLAAVIIIGRLLIKSVKTEIHQKDSLQKLSAGLKIANIRLKQLDAMKTEFVSMASHELLTPISAIEGYLSMIVDEKLVRVDDPKLQKFITNIYKSSKRLARLVADLLNISRIEEGRLLVEKKVVNLAEMIQSTVEELHFKAQDNRIKLSTISKIDPRWTDTFVDADKIKEVLVNLAGNSIKYNKPGGQVLMWSEIWPTMKVEQRFNSMAHNVVDHSKNGQGALQRIANPAYMQMVGDKQIVVAVRDNGVGIAREDIGKLFQKFSRVGDWSTQEVQGTGLGLYVSKALVEMHHGKIWVESGGLNKGSTFYFSLPLAAYAANIKQMDSAVPRQENMKGLARMGGGPAAKV